MAMGPPRSPPAVMLVLWPYVGIPAEHVSGLMVATWA